MSEVGLLFKMNQWLLINLPCMQICDYSNYANYFSQEQNFVIHVKKNYK